MPNIRSKIRGQNKNILQPKPTEPQKLCTCLVKENCPINGLCLRYLLNDIQETLCKPQKIIQSN